MGVSLLLELDGPSYEALGGSFIHGHASLWIWQRMLTFLAMGTTWVLAWEKQLQMAVPLPGVSWQMKQMY